MRCTLYKLKKKEEKNIEPTNSTVAPLVPTTEIWFIEFRKFAEFCETSENNILVGHVVDGCACFTIFICNKHNEYATANPVFSENLCSFV